MRALLLGLAVVVLQGAPASAADVDLRGLVLRQGDVPSGFRVDRSETGVRSNARESRGDPRLQRLFERWGRLTGYQVELERDRGVSLIGSRVDLFRGPGGPRELLAWYDREIRRSGISGLGRTRLAIGAGGLLYRGEAPSDFALVAWRQGRLFAAVVGVGIPEKKTVALARVQERRIAAALR